MAEFTVDQIQKGKEDSSGVKVDIVYTKISAKYAVYRADDRVIVQWADTTTLAEDGTPLGEKQREALGPLTPLRGEINGLIDGWRKAAPFLFFWRRGNCSRARRYDQQVAEALTVALGGDVVRATERLTAIHDAILVERTSLGRVQYVLSALAAGLFAVALSFLVGGHYGSLAGCPTEVPCRVPPDWDNGLVQRWAAAGFGALGAFLSVALQIRQRDVKPDLQTSDNVVDAALRICIGALSAMTLVALLQARLVVILLGSTPINNGTIAFPLLIVVSVAAGFVERLVSDVIGNVAINVSGRTAPVAPVAVPRGSEDDPAGPKTPPAASDGDPGTPKPPGADATAPPPEGDTVDGCPEGHADDGGEATDDAELPEATGGVAGRD